MQIFSTREYFEARAFIRPRGRYLNTAIALIILCALVGHLLIRPMYMYKLWLGACVYFKRIGAIDVRYPARTARVHLFLSICIRTGMD